MNKKFLLILICAFILLPVFSLPQISYIDETDQNPAFMIQYVEEYRTAVFTLTIPVGQFERTKCFNISNDRIRKFQQDNKFNSYFRLSNDVVKYNNVERTVDYIVSVQYRADIYE